MDAFYVSVELQWRPGLKRRPVVGAGSGPRAVVTTASYEARRFGVFSATPGRAGQEALPAKRSIKGKSINVNTDYGKIAVFVYKMNASGGGSITSRRRSARRTDAGGW